MCWETAACDRIGALEGKHVRASRTTVTTAPFGASAIVEIASGGCAGSRKSPSVGATILRREVSF
ncbi:MAG: hypothetical protein DCC68_01670 [Planctomycetota bacterium]|nr:MAG: hypothetical protein DCC68_01670 [Planctomycetota bacterium]